MSEEGVEEIVPKKRRKARKASTARQSLLRLFPQGDFVILKVAQGAEDGAPPGALLPLQPPMHFLSTGKAMKWLRSGESGQGRFVIVKFCKRLSLRASTQVVCKIDESPKVSTQGAAAPAPTPEIAAVP